MISGGEIQNFTEGWALDIWGKQRGHMWKRREIGGVGFVFSKCGLIRTAEWRSKANGNVFSRMYGVGDFPKCKRCKAAA